MLRRDRSLPGGMGGVSDHVGPPQADSRAVAAVMPRTSDPLNIHLIGKLAAERPAKFLRTAYAEAETIKADPANPTVLMATLTNTYGGLITSCVTDDGTQVAGGFQVRQNSSTGLAVRLLGQSHASFAVRTGRFACIGSWGLSTSQAQRPLTRSRPRARGAPSQQRRRTSSHFEVIPSRCMA